MAVESTQPAGDDTADKSLEQALTELAWNDPTVADDPAAALAELGVEVPADLQIDLRIQRRDTLYFTIPRAASDGGDAVGIVNQIDLWNSGDHFVWIMPQEAKVALLQMREQYRRAGSKG